jgi:hypothetical protein
MRAPFDETLRHPDPDPTWNMVLFLMRSHLHQKNVLMSTFGDDSKRALCKCDAPD